MESFRPSHTAKLIARSLVLASEEELLAPLVDRRTGEGLHRIFGKNWFFRSLKWAPFRWFLLRVERVLLPGIIVHYLVRKARIARAVKSAIARGCRRVVVVGAGYDPLLWCLHREYPGVRFVELDHPATQKPKSERLDHDGNLEFVALDLNQDLPSSRIERESGPTVFVLEGLLMYFPDERVGAILKDLAALAGGEGEIVWTFMEEAADGSLGFRGESSLIARWLRRCKEPFLWGISRSDLPEFAKGCGLLVEDLIDDEVLREEHLRPLGISSLALAQGELTCIAKPINL